MSTDTNSFSFTIMKELFNHPDYEIFRFELRNGRAFDAFQYIFLDSIDKIVDNTTDIQVCNEAWEYIRDGEKALNYDVERFQQTKSHIINKIKQLEGSGNVATV